MALSFVCRGYYLWQLGLSCFVSLTIALVTLGTCNDAPSLALENAVNLQPYKFSPRSFIYSVS